MAVPDERRLVLRSRGFGALWEKYGGPIGERFGPTLAAEHLDRKDGLKIDAETVRLDAVRGVMEPRAKEEEAVAGASKSLGLPVVRQIIEMHGGRVWAVNNGLERGATFTFRLPRQRPAEPD